MHIPVTLTTTGTPFVACDIYANNVFVNTSTVQVGGLEYLPNHDWQGADEVVTKKNILAFSDHFQVERGTALCAGTFMGDGETIRSNGRLETLISKHIGWKERLDLQTTWNDSTLEMNIKPKAPSLNKIVIQATGLMPDEKFSSHSSQLYADTGVSISEFSRTTGVDWMIFLSEQNYVSSSFTINSPHFFKGRPNASLRSPVVVKFRTAVQNTSEREEISPFTANNTMGFIYSPNIDKYAITPCVDGEACTPDDFPIYTQCRIDPLSDACKFEKCTIEYNEEECPCDRFSKLVECKKIACVNHPTVACCETFDTEEKCIAFTQCTTNFSVENCSCDEFAELDECKKATCLTNPTTECCSEYNTEEKCITFNECSAEFSAEDCPCDQFSELDGCKKQACLTNPTTECCENYHTEDSCIVFACNQTFVEEECPCDVYPDIKGCHASSSSALFLTFSTVCVAATVANYLL